MPDASPLGDFLRWHRQRLGPDDVGLATHGRRRVPGLGREEVALLAGISFEYYVRLEQGRERSPSVAVLDALAEAFGLDNDQAGHLHELARPRSRRIDAIRETAVPSGSVLLLLAANEMAEALCPNMRAGVNRFRAAFLDPRERELWRDWDQVAANAVAQLRSAIGPEIHSSPVHALIAEMMEKCQYFRQLWSRHDVQQHAMSPVRMRHPRVGDLELYREKLIVAGSDGLVLVMYHAEPGSPSAGRLASLEGSLVA